MPKHRVSGTISGRGPHSLSTRGEGGTPPCMRAPTSDRLGASPEAPVTVAAPHTARAMGVLVRCTTAVPSTVCPSAEAGAEAGGTGPGGGLGLAWVWPGATAAVAVAAPSRRAGAVEACGQGQPGGGLGTQASRHLPTQIQCREAAGPAGTAALSQPGSCSTQNPHSASRHLPGWGRGQSCLPLGLHSRAP